MVSLSIQLWLGIGRKGEERFFFPASLPKLLTTLRELLYDSPHFTKTLNSEAFRRY
jgi:hypothetical protein